MTMASFTPALVLAQLVLKARKNLVAAQFCNTSIGIALKEKGSKLTINTMGDVSSAATSETEPMTYGDVSTTGSDLSIELDQTVSVKLKDSERVQIEASGQMMEAAVASRMVYELNNDIDALVMGKYTECEVDSYETGTTGWGLGADGADVAKFFAGVHGSMDTAECEKTGRFIVLPHLAIQAIRIHLAGKGTPFGDSVVQNGLAFDRALYGFWVYQSSNCVDDSTLVHGLAGNLPNVGEGVPGCIALAVQISPVVEKLRLEGYWGDGLRARATAGALVFKPDRCVDVNLLSNPLA